MSKENFRDYYQCSHKGLPVAMLCQMAGGAGSSGGKNPLAPRAEARGGFLLEVRGGYFVYAFFQKYFAGFGAVTGADNTFRFHEI